MELLRFEEYTFFYNDTDSPALDGINLSVGAGEIVAVCGPSGSGKSTLINSCKPQTAPAGRHTGVIPARPPSGEIAVVFQNPETQIVTTTVINDLVFQMENLGFDRLTMRRRMAETVGFFGLEGLLRRPVGELSGGQKQLVSLCAAMMTRPRLLLLDEPVSQLDPISGGALLETLRRINEEFAVTILLSEHRLDDVAGIARRIVYMERGKIVFDAPARETLTALFRSGRPETACFAPPIPRSSISIDGYAALSPKEFQERYAKPPVKTETPDKRDALPGGRADVTPDSRDAPPDGARDNRDAVPDGRDALPGSRVDAPDNHNAPQDAAPDNSDAVPDNRDAPPDGARDNRDAVPDNRDVLPVSRADASEFRRGAQCASASAANGTGNILQTPNKHCAVAKASLDSARIPGGDKLRPYGICKIFIRRRDNKPQTVTQDNRDATPDTAPDNRDAPPDGAPGNRDTAPDNRDTAPDNRDAPPDGARDNRDALPDGRDALPVSRDVLPVSRADASEFRRGAQCAPASAANGTDGIYHARRAAPGKVSNVPPAISARDVVFQYEPGAPPVIRNLNFSCAPGERLCVVGGNGSGKSTFLKLLCGVLKPQMGKVKRNVPGVGYMPQNVRAYFLSERLEDEIQWGSGGEARVLEETARTLGLSGLMKRHPYDISGGEAQKAVLLAILSRRPGLMILDEPTKGLDPYSKTLFARALRGLAPDAAIVITTHDLEFAAGFATECGMFFDGSLAYRLPPREFFRGNGYYSTAVNRCMQHIDPNAVYYEDVLKIWGIEKPSFTEGLF